MIFIGLFRPFAAGVGNLQDVLSMKLDVLYLMVQLSGLKDAAEDVKSLRY